MIPPARARRDARRSFTRLLSMPAHTHARGRHGCPPLDRSPAERERHLLAATMRLFLGRTIKEAADELDVSPRTVRYWTDMALNYDDPRAETLRRIAGRT